MTTTRLVTILVSALWLVGFASRDPQATTPAASAPRASPPALSQTTVITANTNPVVYVDGEVKTPGRLVWTPNLTLTNAIAMAGGFTDFANKRKLQIRRTSGSVEVYNYSRIRNGSTNDPALKPNDQVVVVRNLF